MNRSIVYTVSIVAALIASAGGYYYFMKTQEMRVDTSSQSQPSPPTKEPKDASHTKPDHGDFSKRFKPDPPPPNGGKSN